MNDLPPETTMVMDVPDERDWNYEIIYGAEEFKPVKFPIDLITVHNQAALLITKMACSRFGMAHIANGQSLLADGTQPHDPVAMWERYWQTNKAAIVEGATAQSILKQARAEGIIAGHGTILSEIAGKQALDRGHFIATGSTNGNWVSVRDNKIYALRTDGKNVGHFWIIFGYDDKGYLALNSYGPHNGVFRLPFNLWDTTFTKYAIIPAKEFDSLQLHRKRIMAKITIESARQAFEDGTWNGEDPQGELNREQGAAMAKRAADNAVAKFKKELGME